MHIRSKQKLRCCGTYTTVKTWDENKAQEQGF